MPIWPGEWDAALLAFIFFMKTCLVLTPLPLDFLAAAVAYDLMHEISIQSREWTIYQGPHRNKIEIRFVKHTFKTPNSIIS
jgi:hypothetical protein